VSYQWFFNGAPLGPPQSGMPELIADQSGEYFVEMTNADGCTLASGPLNLELFDEIGTILGEVYVDVNENGTIDPADTLYSGAVLELLQNGTTLAGAVSNPEGAYAFPGIADGAYTVRLDTSSVSPLGLMVSEVDTAFSGCGTTVTINWLLENCPAITTEASLSGCGSVTYAGMAFTRDTSFTAAYTSSNGCDSLETVSIRIQQASSSTLELGACAGSTINYFGTTLSPGQQRDFTFTNAAGCDSTVTVAVIELQSSDSTLQLSACPGSTADYNGMPLSPGQQQDFTFINAVGCDSIVTVTVAELQPSASTLELSACPGSTADYNGTPLSPGQQQDFTFTNAAGCDSTVTVTVTELQPSASTLQLSACPGSTADYNGTPLSPGQQQDFTFTNAAGCDSVVTVTVTELQSSASSIELSACPGSTADYNGTPLSPGQQQDFTFTNAADCDSVVTVTVTALPATDTLIQLSACAGDTAFFGGRPILAGEALSLSFTNQEGCDSLIRVEVEELPTYRQDVALFTCQDSVFFAGMMLPVGNTEVVLSAQNGCDSVISVQAVRYPEEQTDVVLEACPDSTAIYQGQELAPGEEIMVTLTSQYGCDSVVHVSVQPYPAPGLEAVVQEDCPDNSIGAITGAITQNTIAPYRFSLDGQRYTDNPLFDRLEGGTYTLYAQDGRGCGASIPVEVPEPDSLLLAFIQDSLSCDKPTATLSVNVLSGDDGALEYLWSDGSDGPTLQVDSAGAYAVTVSNSCQVIARQLLVPPPSLDEEQLLYVPNAFSPNEDGQNDRFLPAPAAGVEPLEYEFRVFNRWGAELFSTDQLSEGWDGTVKGQRQNTGVYIWYVKARVRACGQEVEVYREGDVVLMR
ncbi:MAG: gliding motility-associated C-terminal domain-containing protein, partial [Phaeodactylibacter sp.]|nr:gliding motility-associated C-terminal domain-containing protein [Phaeodactylibacter sp.]